MGNICRSPTAEGVFRDLAQRAGLGESLLVDSAGTGDWHVGAPPDRRAVQAAKRRGYDLSPLRARQVEPADFARFGWILAMDQQNLRALEAMRPVDYPGHVGLLLALQPELGIDEVPDPYYGGPEGFEHVLDLVESALTALLERVRAGLGER
jgi:protein-tyrosine phosphatase